MIYVDDAICSENILRQLVDFAYTQNIQIRPGNDNTFGHKMAIFEARSGVHGVEPNRRSFSSPGTILDGHLTNSGRSRSVINLDR